MDKWLEYLNSASDIKYNVANVQSMTELNPRRVKEYVDRCLKIAQSDLVRLAPKYHKYVISTLQWMDVAKCGSKFDRELWKVQHPGICLDVHNEASAWIYWHNVEDEYEETKNIVFRLIETHGLIGQYIMGETSLSSNSPLKHIKMDKDALIEILEILNHAVIAGVSEELWRNIQDEVKILIRKVVDGDYTEDATLARLRKLFPAFKNVEELTDEEEKLYSHIFSNVTLWYPGIALQNFSRKELNTIFKMLLVADFSTTKHISFYDFSKELSYDHNGKRTENVYKKRIVEVLLREMAENSAATCEKEHVKIVWELNNGCLQFRAVFTPVCSALINFCVEAERSGFANYQKNIITIFDMFGFRRDIFDRLSNEEMYLATMNNAQTSTKTEILQYVTGDTIVDVGSGGGILLDMLEKQFHDKHIVGTDISANVIEALRKKIDAEQHRYDVLRHNFICGLLPYKVDTILFSSIIHEIFSYTDYHGRKFNLDAVREALKNAYWSLNHGGRIVIRDGIKTNSNKIVSVRFKDEDTFILAKNFLKDFQGLPELRVNGEWEHLIVSDKTITANINLIREMLYTITWGSMSYPQEVQEQFGYMTLDEYVTSLESLGLHIVEAKEFLEKGYPEHLNDKVELVDFIWEDIPSNCIIVAEKVLTKQ